MMSHSIIRSKPRFCYKIYNFFKKIIYSFDFLDIRNLFVSVFKPISLYLVKYFKRLKYFFFR
jgi:hypothetical protein